MQADTREMKTTIRAAQLGDERAFERLLDYVETPVYRLALSITRRREDAEDATQETLIKLWRSLPSYRFECPILPYVLQIARNAALDLLRRERPHTEHTIPLIRQDENGEETVLEVADTDVASDPVRAYEKQERVEAVRAALDALEHEHREILLLKDINGYTYEQIAVLLGIEMGTVKSRLSRARKKLAEILKTRNIF
jgi:RNA polymerase sigma-70 factor (ECF subfamily)